MKHQLLPKVEAFRQSLDFTSIPEDRISIIDTLIKYIQSKKDEGQLVQLNLVCTHNSRRSQLSQLWAQVAADYYGIQAICYSGGVEVTAFNHRAVASIQRMGIELKEQENGSNTIYNVIYSPTAKSLTMFSKIVEDKTNANHNFAAVMTCSHADENCPVIHGADARIPLRYEDPKAFDDTDLEASKYDERSVQIATEMFYIFSQIN